MGNTMGVKKGVREPRTRKVPGSQDRQWSSIGPQRLKKRLNCWSIFFLAFFFFHYYLSPLPSSTSPYSSLPSKKEEVQVKFQILQLQERKESVQNHPSNFGPSSWRSVGGKEEWGPAATALSLDGIYPLHFLSFCLPLLRVMRVINEIVMRL